MHYLARRLAPSRSFRPYLEALEARATPATFTVTTNLDTITGSLRQAILSANSTPGLDTINFNIPGGGLQLLRPTTPLPTVTDAVTLNAATQPGYAGTPVVWLDGSLAGAGANGLVLTTNGSTVFGLSVTNFGGNGISLVGGGGNSLFGNYVGLTPQGNGLGNNKIGVLIAGGSANNNVGVGSPNFISGNGLIGLCVYGAGTNSNTIANNFLGTNPAATAALPNGMAGVDIQAGAVGNTFSANVVSGNGAFGFLIADAGTSSNIITRNLIGLNGTGNGAVANGFAGVMLAGAATGNTVGGMTGAAGNLISGNGAFGVFVHGAGTSGNVIGGNAIGLKSGGTVALANGLDGVALQDGAANNLLTADTISGNVGNNVMLTGVGTTQNVVMNCFIGVSAAGNAAVGSNSTGVRLQAGASSNLISGCTIANNVSNVSINDAGTTANAVQGCFIGTDSTGSATLGGTVGVFIFKASGNVVGGTAAGARNVISGNNIAIRLTGDTFTTSTGNAIVGNFIGTNAAGTGKPSGTSQTRGIDLEGDSHETLIYFNVISGNTFYGVHLTGRNNTVFGNLIGLSAPGTGVVPNGIGVTFDSGASGNVVGGTTADHRNFISGNTGVGVKLAGGSANVIQGNVIGLKADGVSALGNDSHGVQVTANSYNNTIGGTAAGAGNVIAFNGGSAVAIDVVGGTLVQAGTGNAILGNSMFANSALGIDLGNDGVTPNGNQVGNQSPNHFLNYPVLTRAFATGSVTVLQGTYAGLNAGRHRLEFFASPVGYDDGTGHGEGKTFLGYVSVSYSGGGVSAPFAVALVTGDLSGQAISATATDEQGNTSECSLNLTAG